MNVAVVGGGIIGLTTAIALRQSGVDVTIFDANGVGRCASSAANGALTPYSDGTMPDFMVSFAEESQRLYPSFLDTLTTYSELSVPLKYHGTLELFDDEASARNLLDGAQARGWPVEYANANMVKDLEPCISDGLTSGVLFRGEAPIDIDMLLRACQRSCENMGTRIREGTRVIDVRDASHGVYLECRTPNAGSTKEAFDAVVLTLGVGTVRVNGLTTPLITPVRGEIVELLGTASTMRRCLYWNGVFVTPKSEGRVLVGTTYNIDEPCDGVTVFRARASAVSSILHGLFDLIPAAHDWPISRVWTGWRPFSPDSVPVVGRFRSERIYLGMGLGGLGFTLAPYIATQLAALMLGGTVHPELVRMDPGRF